MATEENDFAAMVRERDAAIKNDAKSQAKISELEAKISELNAESKRHRLNSEAFKGDIDRIAKREEETKTAHEAALEALRAELSGKVTEAETKATDAASKARARSVQADLRIAAKDAGMVDLDLLKLISADAIKADEDGNVTNAADIMADLKKSKPYGFGTATTAVTTPAPKPASNEPKLAKDMTPDERKASARKLGITGQI